MAGEKLRNNIREISVKVYVQPNMCQLVQNNTTLFCIASFIQSVSQNHFTGLKQYSYQDK